MVCGARAGLAAMMLAWAVGVRAQAPASGVGEGSPLGVGVRGGEGGCVQVRLEPHEAEQGLVLVDGVVVTTLKRLQEMGGAMVTNCVSLRWAEGGGGVAVGGTCRSVCLGGAGLEGWQAQIPEGASLLAKVDFGRGLVDVVADAGNGAPVTMVFVDGAVVGLGPGSGGRVDVFRDRTYVFSARGRVTGRDGGGAEVTLHEHTMPLTGGPWVERRGEGGEVVRERMSPTASVMVAGEVGGAVTVRMGEQVVTLAGGERGSLALPNGAEVSFQQDPRTRTLVWQVGKGDFRISVEGIPGWEAVGLTGLSGAMAWSVDTGSVALGIDVANRSAVDPGNTMLVGLPGQVTARVAPGATFQYMGGANPGDFQTAALGGSVVLMNLTTGQVADLEAGSMAFRGGRPLVPGGGIRANDPVTIRWGANAAVELSGMLEPLSVAPGGTKEVRAPGGNVLRVSNEPGVGLVLQSVSGDFTFMVAGTRSGTITLPQGGMMALGFDGSAGVMTAATTRGRAVVTTPDGLSRDLPVGMMMTVVNGRMTTGSARREEDLVYFQSLRRSRAGAVNDTELGLEQGAELAEGAGAGGGGAGFRTTLTGGGTENLLDLSRISQPPASTTGRE